MIKSKLLLIGLGLAVLAVMYYTFFGGDNSTADGGLTSNLSPEIYRQQLTQERSDKDKFFRTSAESPIADKKSFTGLTYFVPNLTCRVVARLEPFADKTQKLVVRMSDGSEEVYDKFAHAVFRLQGETCRLLVVKLDNTYSILFRDVTSGKATYGGGRYLEINPSQLTDTQAVLDFNNAYNPYCAYAPSYACPLPPAENTLSIAVNAGEKYVAHD